MRDTRSPVIVALDFAAAKPALELARQLPVDACRLKVGKELFTATGPALVEQLQMLGHEVFLDLKFHDIPNTVAAAVRSASELGVWMVNVHASGGRRMLSAAAESIAKAGGNTLLIGVTVLTSLDESDFLDLGYSNGIEDQVMRLAALCRESGLDGVVCSAKEAASLRGVHPADFALVTPGIRPAGTAADDQRRIVTPEQALADGSSYLVIGRPITQADSPEQVLRAINDSLGF